MDDIHRQARDLYDRMQRYTDASRNDSRGLIDHARNFMELVEMKKDRQHLLDAIKRLTQEIEHSKGMFSHDDWDDLRDRAIDIRKDVEHL